MGRLDLSLDHLQTKVTGAPTLVAAIANAIAMNVKPEFDDQVVHERAQALIRSRFAGEPDFVWEVSTELCREGLLVRGRASTAALNLYYALIPAERFFIFHLSDANEAKPPGV